MDHECGMDNQDKLKIKLQSTDRNNKVLSSLLSSEMSHYNEMQCKKTHKCPCGKAFEHYYQLEKHSKTHDKLRFQCSKCSKSYARRYELVQHHKNKHEFDQSKKSKPMIINSVKEIQDKVNMETTENNYKLLKGLLSSEIEQNSEIKCDKSHRCQCGKAFEHYYQLEKHTKTHIKVRFNCSQCPKFYPKRYQLKRHCQTKHTLDQDKELKDVNFNCKDCDKSFMKKRYLQEHLKIHRHKDFQCDICGACFAQKNTLVSHQKRHNAYKPYKCEHCDFRSHFNSVVKLHFARRHCKEQEKQYKCKQCKKEFSQEYRLKVHIAKIHVKRQLFKCKKCSNCFTSYLKLSKHQSKCCIVDCHQCEQCSVIFLKFSDLKKHVRLKHLNQGSYVCSDCGKRFAVRESYERHLLNSHIGDKPFLCVICGKGYLRKSGLLHHIKNRHVGKSTLECRECKLEFKSNSMFTCHMLLNHMDKIIECEECDLGLTTFTQYKDHMRIHNNSKAYRCCYCERGFNEREQFMTHMEKHSAIKPFKCEECSKYFDTLKGLKLHEKIHLEDFFDLDKMDILKEIENENPDRNGDLESERVSEEVNGRGNPEQESLFHETVANQKGVIENKKIFREGCSGGIVERNISTSVNETQSAINSILTQSYNQGYGALQDIIHVDNYSNIETVEIETERVNYNTIDVSILDEAVSNVHSNITSQQEKCKCNKDLNFFCGAKIHRNCSSSGEQDQLTYTIPVVGTRDVKINRRSDGSSITTFTDTQDTTADTSLVKSYSCECGKNYPSISELEKHAITHMKIVAPKSLKCKKCKKQFLSADYLHKHILEKHKNLLFQCNLCGSFLKTRKTLQKHIKKMHNPNYKRKLLLKCEACPMEFLNKSSLESHSRSHSGLKPFICGECGKCFTYKSSLTLHTRKVHTQEKPFSCQICKACFMIKKDLKVHLQIHSEVQTYSCEECGRCYPERRDLMNHLYKAHKR